MSAAVQDLLPLVSHEIAVRAFTELLQQESEKEAAGDATDFSAYMDEVNRIAGENPELVGIVNVALMDSGVEEKVAGLMGMVVTYRALRAQAEADALVRLMGAC